MEDAMVLLGDDNRAEEVWLSAPARPFWALARHMATEKT
jgi:hypothetical protein